MHEAIRGLLERYACQTREDYLNALREILQELALLGLWRARFFEHAAFYGGSALRLLHGMDRYSEDLDFSLLRPAPDFTLEVFGAAVWRLGAINPPRPGCPEEYADDSHRAR